MIDEVLGGRSWRTDLFDLDVYLRTIGIEPAEADLGLLERLLHAHVHTFPFANVDVLLGAHPGVAPDRVQQQLVDRRRGGYCFEHVQIVAAALEHLGFVVRRALGRVHETFNARSHMTVLAEIDGRWWLGDPGFGFSLMGPIELADGAARTEGDRVFSIERRHDSGAPIWTLRRDGVVQHHVDELPVHPTDVRVGHFYTSRNEHSGFVRRLVVARHLGDEHVTLTATHRTIRVPGRETVQEELTVDEVIDEVGRLGVRLEGDEPERLTEIVTRLRG